MSIVNAPRAGVPIGFVTIQGQRIEVVTHSEYQLFFETLLRRVGGPTGVGTPDLVVSQFEDAGIEETKALLYLSEQAAAQLPIAEPLPCPEVASPCDLQEQITALALRVQALEQGVSA
jgi:hypothetical protein